MLSFFDATPERVQPDIIRGVFRGPILRTVAVAMVLACCRPVGWVRAQSDADPSGAAARAVEVEPTSGAEPQPEAETTPQPTMQQVSSGEVVIRVESFGIGDTVREGDWAGIRLALTDRADTPREVAVQLHLPDGDGDTPLYTRVITLSPGREVGVWLYAPMPWGLRQGSVLRVSISRAEPREDGVRIAEQIAWAPIAARRVVPSSDSMAAAVGQSALGLEQYAVTFRERDDNPGSNELTQSILGLSPGALPDSWMGWAAISTIVWSDGDPAMIQGEAPAKAMREWVSRGGHLVVVIPPVGEAWSSSSNPLSDIMPVARIEKLVDIDLAPYRTLLTGSSDGGRALPEKAVVHRFVTPESTEARDATPVINGPQGCVVVRRLVGAGMVTLVGLDLNSRALTQRQTVRADAFWSRILGRRDATMTVAEMDSYATASKDGWGRSVAASVWIDDRVGTLISRGRAASMGVLLGLVTFISYWFIAAPFGFWLLKRRGLERHSWLVFVLTTAVFTVAAWAGASALRPRVEQAWHYTILDHIYGQPVQRARSFVSVLLPTYGSERITLGDPETDQSWSQALVPWTDPASESQLSFPDARSYLADVRSLTQLEVPARSTIKTFRAEWLGGPRWSMPGPVDSASRPRIEASGKLSGTLVHGLPGSLRDVQVILVKGQISEQAGEIRRDTFSPRALIAEAYAWTLPGDWAPSQPLQLSAFEPSDKAKAEDRLRDMVPRIRALDAAGLLPASVTDGDIEDIAALYPLIAQPDPGRFASMMEQTPAIPRRRSLHGLDIAKWLTQPCLIIIGRVDDAPGPVPMYVGSAKLDNKERPSEGRTIVRWIYPLAPRPHRVGDAPAMNKNLSGSLP